MIFGEFKQNCEYCFKVLIATELARRSEGVRCTNIYIDVFIVLFTASELNTRAKIGSKVVIGNGRAAGVRMVAGLAV